MTRTRRPAHVPAGMPGRPRAVIIGMPGAGKTRIGRETARMLDVDFHDSDARIEHESGERIPDYFDRHGEASFRRLESRIVMRMLTSCDGILSLGGGAPMTPSVQDALRTYVRDGGTLVYLQADPHEAMERAVRAGGRPMLAGDARRRWRSLYERRDPVFDALATVHVRTQRSSPAAAARKLVEMISQKVVHVPVDGGSDYDVRIGVDAMESLSESLGASTMRVALVHSTPVQRHADRARALLRRSGYEVAEIVIPDAEAGKTVQVADGVWSRLADEGFTRSDAIVGLGGGAATDLAGFAAATWMRGIRYVNCPTSLLAMVDASTGGKTGVNIPQGKNLVGSFFTPTAVLADLRTLVSLPRDVFVEGLGEVAKSGLISDVGMLGTLRDHADGLRNFDGPSLAGTPLEDVVAELIERTVRVKVHHVATDLRESGLREFLNYGHTLGHAIEQIEHFRWRHGNAVAVGCVFAAELSNVLGLLDESDVALHRELLSSLGLPVSWSGGDWPTVLELMHHDKKARGNTLRFVILESIGHPRHLDDPPLDAVHEAFERIRG